MIHQLSHAGFINGAGIDLVAWLLTPRAGNTIPIKRGEFAEDKPTQFYEDILILLSIKDLSHTYANGVRALNNINLDIPKGMFGFLGPNGVCKSSLMRTIATLQQPTEGAITFDD